MPENAQNLINQLRNDLLYARKSRDEIAADALRSVINAIDNASSVVVVDGTNVTEAPRHEVSYEEITALIEDEIDELQQAVAQLNGGDPVLLKDLQTKAIVLEKYLHKN